MIFGMEWEIISCCTSVSLSNMKSQYYTSLFINIFKLCITVARFTKY